MKKDFSVLIKIFGFGVLFVFSCFGQKSNVPISDAKTEIQTLEFAQTIEREISGGQRHVFKIKLESRQFVSVEVEQTNCDVILSMLSPEKTNLFEYKDDNFRNGLERQTAAVEAAGEYELRITSFEAPQQKGTFRLRIAEMRAATEKELSLTDGLKLHYEAFAEANPTSATRAAIEKGIEKFNLALEKFRFAGQPKFEASTLNNIGILYGRLGNRKKALEYHQTALQVVNKAGLSNSTTTYASNLGMAYLDSGEPQKALDVLFQALNFANEDDFLGKSRALNNIGSIYEKLGDTERALIYYEQALPLSKNTGEKRFEAVSLNNLGKASLELGENRKALEYFEKALALAHAGENKRHEAAFRGNIAQTYFALGETAKALEFFTESLKINRALGDKIGEAAILQKLGQTFFALGETEKASENLNQALEIYRSIEEKERLATTLLDLAKIDARKGNLETAQSKTEEAIALIEKVRARVRIADLRDSFSANLKDFYGFYVETLMARHKLAPDKNFAALALSANESARARGLLNLLTESNADLRQGTDAKLLERETGLKNLLSVRLENLTKVLSGKPKEEIVHKLKVEIEQIRAETEQIQSQIRAASPRYAALTQPKTLSLGEIQTEVLDADSVLMEYALGETKSFLWLVAKNDFRVFELPAKSEIETMARRFYESLTARNKQVKFETPAERGDRIFLADSDAQKFARELSEKILAPATPFLANKRLLIVADGALQYVPFASLKVSSLKSQVPSPVTKIEDRRLKTEDRFLIETNEIVNLPSASALAVLRKETGGRTVAPKTLAVLADPVFDKTDERFLAIGNKDKPKQEFIAVSKKQQTRGADFSFTRDGLDLSRLPFTRREANSISALVPDNQKEKLLDFSATRQAAMSPELANYRFVHFATHGFINNENPELSGIIFSMIDENGKEQDGFLRVGDVYNLKLPAEMVVLSGCRTGLGKEIKGEGLIGLTRGFMYAGARRVAVSLWDVNDEATSELMAQFYREMLGAKKLSPAAALRQSQISMLRKKEWNNPFYWATFTLQGEPK